MKTLSKVVSFQKWKDLRILNEKFQEWYPHSWATCLYLLGL